MIDILVLDYFIDVIFDVDMKLRFREVWLKDFNVVEFLVVRLEWYC